MNLRGLSALALLLVATAMERFAYYGSRSFLSLDLRTQGATPLSIGTTMTALQGLVFLGLIVGGAAAFAIGPRATAVAGALLATIGHFALAAGAPIVVGAGVVAFAAGVFRPCPYAAAAETLAWDDESPSAPGPHRFAAVTAFAVAAYGAINAGSLLAPAIAGALRGAEGAGLSYGVNGAVMILATASAAVAAVLGVLGQGTPAEGAAAKGPYRRAEARPAYTPPPATTMLGGLAILVVPQVVYLLGTSLSAPPFELMSGTSRIWLYSVNPVVVMMVSMAVFAILLAAAIQRWTLPPLLFYGAGLVIFALGLIQIAAAGSTSAVLYTTGAIVAGAGEAVAAGVPIAYAAIAVRGRAATLLVAGWFAIGLIVSTVSGTLNAVPGLRAPLLGLCALVCLGAGAALVAFARTLHQTFFDPQEPARSNLV